MEMEAETVTLDLSAPPAPVTPPVAPAPVPEFTGKPGNFAADMAALAAEEAAKAPVPAAPAPEPTQAQPAITESATAPVTVPEKFKDADGKIDEAKVAKSTYHAEEALKRALEVEKQLRQKQNEVAALKSGSPVPVAPAPVPNVQLTPFEIQVAQDLINEAAAAGYQMPQGQAIAQARVIVRMNEAKHNADVSLTEQLRQRIEDQDRRRELEAIAKEDNSVLSPEGIDALAKIRQENPWVNQAPNPWQAAYDLHIANQTRTQRLSGQVQPTPKGLTAKAPPTPVSPAPRVVVKSEAPVLETKEQIDAHLKSMTPEQEAKFWASKGFRF